MNACARDDRPLIGILAGMKADMIWTTTGGMALKIERLERSARFQIVNGHDVLATAEIEDWKFGRVIEVLQSGRRAGSSPLFAKDVPPPQEADCI